MRIVEVLARHGILTGARADAHARRRTRDIDVRLIADASDAARAHAAVVPTGHEVLVVDDEAVVLTVLREALRRGGYRVTTAASAEEAIDLMHKRRFDLVLTDKNLPGASGLDVLRAARTLDARARHRAHHRLHARTTRRSRRWTSARTTTSKSPSATSRTCASASGARSRAATSSWRAREAGADRRARGRACCWSRSRAQRRQLIAEYLGKAHHVTAAKDGDEALALLKSEHFDLVLADRHLPGMSGLRVIEHAQRLLPHCASVLYTAYPSYDSVKEAFATGVDAYLVRPSEDLKKLGEKVAEALGGRGGILLG